MFANTVIALKSLVVMHKYVLFGPPEALQSSSGNLPAWAFAENIIIQWNKIHEQKLKAKGVGCRARSLARSFAHQCSVCRETRTDVRSSAS